MMNDPTAHGDPSHAEIRALFPVCDAHAYLNNAGVAPTSLPVKAAIDRFLDDLIAHGLHDEVGWEGEAARVRDGCARLVGAEAAEIALVRNTSHGLGLVAEGLPWEAGDEVAICSAVEYPSNVYVWQHLASRGVRLRPVSPVGDGVTAEAVARALTPRTRLVSVSAVQFASGHRTDLAALGALCRERGVWLCVDGIQQVGVHPLDVKALGVHFLSADSHKWMLGLPGIGFLYVDAALLPQLRPVLVGWKSTTDPWNFDRCHFELRSDATKFEEGSPAYPLIYGLGAAVDLLHRVGVGRIAAHVATLLAAAETMFTGAGWSTNPNPTARAGILMAAPPAGVDLQAVASACAAAGVTVSVRRGRLRISPHIYNHAEDIAKLAEVVTRVGQ